MKKAWIIILVTLCFSCCSQTQKGKINTKFSAMKTLVVTKDFEKFKFDKYDSVQGSSIYFTDDGTCFEYFREGDEYVSRETPGDAYFRLVKIFYLNGNIKEKGLFINSGDFKKGFWYYFNETGNLIEEEDNDRFFPYTFDDLVKYLTSEHIPLTMGFIENGFHTSIRSLVNDQGTFYLVKWLKDTSGMPNKIEEILIDGRSGKVVSKNLIAYRNN
jgi:hypothetical protein